MLMMISRGVEISIAGGVGEMVRAGEMVRETQTHAWRVPFYRGSSLNPNPV